VVAVTRAKVPTRREIRATMLDAMSAFLEASIADDGNPHHYLRPPARTLADEQVAHWERVRSVGKQLRSELSRRAERLRK
jgi:hypothetical protein